MAILCSGQGSQHPEMFDLVAQAPETKPILDAARARLAGQFPSEPEDLFSNRSGQILCCAQALAAWTMLKPHLPEPIVVAGYSVGELAAWACAGLIQTDELFHLAATRAELMDAAAPDAGGLLAIQGLDQNRVNLLCRDYGAHLAIVNGSDFFVIGSLRERLGVLREHALAAGAYGATILRVAVAAHTLLLASASEAYRETLEKGQFPNQIPAEIRLLSGLDGDAVFDLKEGRRKLAAQISQTLHWSACLESCRSFGAEIFLELGPGRALSRMVRANLPQAQTRSLDDFRTSAGVIDWVRKSGCREPGAGT